MFTLVQTIHGFKVCLLFPLFKNKPTVPYRSIFGRWNIVNHFVKHVNDKFWSVLLSSVQGLSRIKGKFPVSLGQGLPFWAHLLSPVPCSLLRHLVRSPARSVPVQSRLPSSLALLPWLRRLSGTCSRCWHDLLLWDTSAFCILNPNFTERVWRLPSFFKNAVSGFWFSHCKGDLSNKYQSLESHRDLSFSHSFIRDLPHPTPY